MVDKVMSKLVFSALEMIGAIIGFIILICIDNYPLAGVLFVYPTIVGALKAITVERDEIGDEMRSMNLIIFVISVLAIVGFVLSAIGIIQGNPAVLLALGEPMRYAFYMAFYYRKLNGADKKK